MFRIIILEKNQWKINRKSRYKKKHYEFKRNIIAITRITILKLVRRVVVKTISRIICDKTRTVLNIFFENGSEMN